MRGRRAVGNKSIGRGDHAQPFHGQSGLHHRIGLHLVVHGVRQTGGRDPGGLKRATLGEGELRGDFARLGFAGEKIKHVDFSC